MKPTPREGLLHPERADLIRQIHKNNSFAQLLGIEIIALGEGFSRLRLGIGKPCTNPYGGAHGGVIATLADIAMGIALRTLGLQPVTVELTVNYLGPAQEGDQLVTEGRVIHRGKSLILAECLVTDGENREVARGRGIFTTRRQ